MLLQAPLLHEVVFLTMAHASSQDSLTAPRELALTTLSRSNNSRTSCPLCRLQGRVRLSRDGDGTGGCHDGMHFFDGDKLCKPCARRNGVSY